MSFICLISLQVYWSLLTCSSQIWLLQPSKTVGSKEKSTDQRQRSSQMLPIHRSKLVFKGSYYNDISIHSSTWGRISYSSITHFTNLPHYISTWSYPHKLHSDFSLFPRSKKITQNPEGSCIYKIVTKVKLLITNNFGDNW